MNYYADTSFAASLYIASDGNNAAAIREVDALDSEARILYSPITQLEFHNLLARYEHKGLMHPGDTRAVLKLVAEDLQNGVMDACPLHTYSWLENAHDIVERITPVTGTRTLDAMHLAVARMNGAKTLMSFDKNQRKAAKAAGFALLPASL